MRLQYIQEDIKLKKSGFYVNEKHSWVQKLGYPYTKCILKNWPHIKKTQYQQVL